MKRGLKVLVAVLILIPIICAQPIQLPSEKPVHKDPRTVQELAPLPLSLNLVVLEILDKINQGSYNASIILSMYLERAKGPLETLLKRVGRLAREASINLMGAEKEITYAEKRLADNDVAKAKKHLIDARKSLDLANESLLELRDALKALSARLNAPARLLEDRYKGLDEKLGRLDERLRELALRVQGYNVTRTYITLNVAPQNPKYGDTVDIYGRLFLENGTLLRYRPVIVRFGGLRETVRTNYLGEYSVEVRATNLDEWVRVTVFYNASGNPQLSSAMNTTVVHILLNETKISATLPDQALPGETIRINVTIKPGHPGRELKIYFDRQAVLEANITGQRTLELKIPEKASEGKHLVQLYVKEAPGYKPATLNHFIAVVKMPVEMRLEQTRVFSIYPILPLSFKGRVETPLGEPVPGNITIVAGGRTLTTVKVYGDFDAQASPTPALIEYSETRLLFQPESPIYKAVEETIHTVNINILSTLAVAVLAWAIYMLDIPYRIYYRIRGQEIDEHILFLPNKIAKRIQSYIENKRRILQKTWSPLTYRGRMGPAVWSLVNVVTLLYRKIAIPIRRHETFREYLMRISGKIAFRAFMALRGLIRYAEMERYGSKKIPKKIVYKYEKEVLENVEE